VSENEPPIAPPDASNHHPRQESDLRSVKVVLLVFGALVLLTAFFSGWAALTVDARTGRLVSPDHPGPDAEVLERTDIEFSLFELEAPGLEKRARDRRRLDDLGWVDRDRGIAHVPIDLAMMLTIDRLRATRPEEDASPKDEGEERP
jgi:hypothetical protein